MHEDYLDIITKKVIMKIWNVWKMYSIHQWNI